MNKCCALLLLLATIGCGARSGLGWLSLSSDPTGSPEPSLGGAQALGGSVAVSGGETAGGAPSFGGAPASGAPGAPQTGAAGTPPVVDDPATLGDERAGFVQCGDANGVLETCQTECCGLAKCAPDATHPCNTCDGPEDCPNAQCCRVDGHFQCAAHCATAPIRHLNCEGPCADTDSDAVPDSVDQCIVSEWEDGKWPLPEDGCSDFDGDGVHDGLDKCPTKLEDGLPPKPNDGCPQGS